VLLCEASFKVAEWVSEPKIESSSTSVAIGLFALEDAFLDDWLGVAASESVAAEGVVRTELPVEPLLVAARSMLVAVGCLIRTEEVEIASVKLRPGALEVALGGVSTRPFFVCLSSALSVALTVA
jgi:hypothetical protein